MGQETFNVWFNCMNAWIFENIDTIYMKKMFLKGFTDEPTSSSDSDDEKKVNTSDYFESFIEGIKTNQLVTLHYYSFFIIRRILIIVSIFGVSN